MNPRGAKHALMHFECIPFSRTWVLLQKTINIIIQKTGFVQYLFDNIREVPHTSKFRQASGAGPFLAGIFVHMGEA